MRILDACCGGRMFWFDKQEPHTTYMDIRTFGGELCDGRKFNVNPDVIGDFRNIPFDDNTFDMVVFDPPHLVKGGDNGWQIIKYGRLNKESWKEDIRKGFEECFRVLKQEGVLIFKWNEQQIKINEVLPLCPIKPIFGQRGYGKTHWLVFFEKCMKKKQPTTNQRRQMGEMTHKEQLEKMLKFVKTVQDMRDAQKAYFKTRNREILIKSKSLEAKVDVMADEIIDMIGDATPAEEQEQK